MAEKLDLPPGAAPPGTKLNLPPGAELTPAVTEAVPVNTAAQPTTNTVPFVSADDEKLGGKCCGSCCDYRRAVIIMSALSILFGALGLITTLRGNTNNIDDDRVATEIENIAEDYSTQTIILQVVGFVFAILSLCGAISFRWQFIAAAAAWAVIGYIASVIFSVQQTNDVLDWLAEQDFIDDVDEVEQIVQIASIIGYVIAGIVVACWIYPSVFLTREIKNGIMTRETYPREEYSCCCV